MTREHILKNSYAEKETISQISRNIAEVEMYLEKVVADHYFSNLKDDFDKRYGVIKHFFVKIENTSNHRFEADWSAISVEKLGEAKEAYNNLHEQAEQQKKNDLRKAFDIMYNHLFEWWD